MIHQKDGGQVDKTISHYKILEKLGEGGMGVVYKAEDAKLQRTVALKFLPLDVVGDDEARTRFINEARAASALNHPNICTIHAVEDGEQPFIAMEFVEGQELREIIENPPSKRDLSDSPFEGGQGDVLPVDTILNYATQIAKGLQAAHKKNIIHRDIKPANIMVTEDGQVKIMDFGLAKRQGQPALTKTGSTLGTVAYMSPEQAQSQDVDPRSDIFSFGAVLYELCSGSRPFEGEYEAAIIYALVNENPPPLPENVPDALRDVVFKCLEKKVENRYQSMEKLLVDFQKLQQGIDGGDSHSVLNTVKPEKSIVVLPFDDLSPHKDNEYFSDGLTEEIITDLSQVHTLRVISRNSAMMLKGTKKGLNEIARELNVQYALMGSVRKAGNNLRISAQLLDTRSDSYLWAEKYKGTLEDIFDIQEQVSRSIVDALKVKLTAEEEQKIVERPIEDVHAYECFLRARQEIWHFTEEGLDRALILLQNGLDIVGDNALLYATMGTAYFQYINAGIKGDLHYLDKAQKCAKKAFNLDSDSSMAHFLAGVIQYKRGNMQEAVRYMKKALEIDPNNLDALLVLPVIYSFVGKSAEGWPLINHLLEIDPLTPINFGAQGWLEQFDGNFKKAVDFFRKYSQMEPDNPFAKWAYTIALSCDGRIHESPWNKEWAKNATPETMHDTICKCLNFALQKDADKALQSLTADTIKAARLDENYSWNIAACYALLDLKNEALDWLEIAVRKGLINYQFFAKHNPFLDNIRSEPRFKKLLARIKREWENFEV